MRPDVEGMKRWLQEFSAIAPDDATDLVVYVEELEAQLAAKDKRIRELEGALERTCPKRCGVIDYEEWCEDPCEECAVEQVLTKTQES